MSERKRSARVGVRLRERERVILEAAAEVRGVPLSALVREGSLKAARRALRAGEEAPEGSGADREALG